MAKTISAEQRAKMNAGKARLSRVGMDDVLAINRATFDRINEQNRTRASHEQGHAKFEGMVEDNGDRFALYSNVSM